MNIFNRMSISYMVELIGEKKEFRTYKFYINGEGILIENSNFSYLPLNDQCLIIKKFIEEDRVRYKTKKYFNVRWEEV